MTFSERLYVPVAYWAIAAAFGLTFIIAIGGFFSTRWFVVAAIVGCLGIGWALVSYGWVKTTVTDKGIRVGRSVLEWPYAGSVKVLDSADLTRRLGVEADARAFLRVRPYVKGAVEIQVNDAADPHPYWLIASRRPTELAAAIIAHQDHDAEPIR